jgi:hypothetical protein
VQLCESNDSNIVILLDPRMRAYIVDLQNGCMRCRATSSQENRQLQLWVIDKTEGVETEEVTIIIIHYSDCKIILNFPESNFSTTVGLNDTP